jgi:hypothetical protein
MALALAELEQSIAHLKSQYSEMPIDYHIHITNRLVNKYGIYIDLLNTLVSYEKGMNRLHKILNDQTIRDTQEQHDKVLQEFKNDHNTTGVAELENDLKLIKDKYTPDKYVLTLSCRLNIYSADKSTEAIACELQNNINNYLDGGTAILDNYAKDIYISTLESMCKKEQQAKQAEFDNKLKKFEDELNSETSAVIEQCNKSVVLRDKIISGYTDKINTATTEREFYSKRI